MLNQVEGKVTKFSDLADTQWFTYGAGERVFQKIKPSGATEGLCNAVCLAEEDTNHGNSQIYTLEPVKMSDNSSVTPIDIYRVEIKFKTKA